MNWFIVNTCALYGTFQAKLSPGTYSLTLSYCLQSPERRWMSERNMWNTIMQSTDRSRRGTWKGYTCQSRDTTGIY